MEIHPAARSHAVADDVIRHAVNNAIAYGPAEDEEGEEIPGYLVLGPDVAGNLLEVIVVVREDDEPLAIHAMSMRPKYQHLLP